MWCSLINCPYTAVSQSNEPVLITLSCIYQIIIAKDLSAHGSYFVLDTHCTSGQETNRANGWILFIIILRWYLNAQTHVLEDRSCC